MSRQPVLNTKEDWLLGVVLVWTLSGITLLTLRIIIKIASMT